MTLSILAILSEMIVHILSKPPCQNRLLSKIVKDFILVEINFERDFSIPFHNRFDLLSSDAVACQEKLNEPFRCIVCQTCLEIPLSNC